MKQSNKKLNLSATLVLLVFAVLCAVNVTYSYFTATANASGSGEFGSIEVYFRYSLDEHDDSTVSVTDKTTTLEVVPEGGTISRNAKFNLCLASNNTRIYDLAIEKNSGCNVYVRVWVDAYLKSDIDNNVANPTNYGKYFLLNSANLDQGAQKFIDGKDVDFDSHCYFIKDAIGSNAAYLVYSIGGTLTLSDLYDDESGDLVSEVPIEIVGEQLVIYISFEAVQSANQAFKSEFGDADDTLGYYSGWN